MASIELRAAQDDPAWVAATDAGGPGPQLDACFNAFSVRLYG